MLYVFIYLPLDENVGDKSVGQKPNILILQSVSNL